MLHFMLQKHGYLPDEIYSKPRKVKNFIYASNLLQWEEEEKASKK